VLTLVDELLSELGLLVLIELVLIELELLDLLLLLELLVLELLLDSSSSCLASK